MADSMNDREEQNGADAAQSASEPVTATPPPPPVPQPPVPDADAGSAAADTRSSWGAAFSRHVLIGAAAHAGIAVGAAVVGGLILFAVVASLGDFQPVPGAPVESVVDPQSAIGLIFTLAAFVYSGELSAALNADMSFISMGGGGSLWLFPLLLTGAALVIVAWWGMRQERVLPLPSRGHRAALAAGVGVATGLIMLAVAAIATINIQTFGASVTLTAVGWRVPVVGAIFVGAAAFLGRWLAASAEPSDSLRSILASSWRGRVPRVLREALSYAAAGSVVFGLIGAIYLVVIGWRDLGAAALLVAVVGSGNVAPLAAAFGHGAGVTMSSSMNGAVTAETQSVFTAGEPILWVLVLLTVLFSVFIAIWIGARRPWAGPTIAWRTSWIFPLVVAGGWVLGGLFFFGVGVAVSGGAGPFGGGWGGGIGGAWWSPIVFFIWAYGVELGAQTLPRFIDALSPRALALIAGKKAATGWASGAASSAVLTPQAAESSAQLSASEPGRPQSGVVAEGDATNPEAGDGQATSPARQPLSPRARKQLVVGLISVGGVVLIGIAAAVGIGIANAGRTAEAQVQKYLEYIAAGDAEAANALADPNVPTAARAFLTDEALAATSARITEVSAEEFHVDSSDDTSFGAGDDRTYVTVRYRLDGVPQEQQLGVVKGDPEWLVLDTWTIVDSLVVPVTLSFSGTGEASIGGVAVPIESSDGGYGTANVVMYPGVYELSGGDSRFFELDETQLLVDRANADHAFAFAPTEALADEVGAQVDAVLAECVKQTAARPEGCPFSAYTYGDDTKVTWKLQGEPEIELDEWGRSVTVSGVAVGSYSETIFSQTREQEDEDSFTMYADVIVEGDQVTVEVKDSLW